MQNRLFIITYLPQLLQIQQNKKTVAPHAMESKMLVYMEDQELEFSDQNESLLTQLHPEIEKGEQ